MYRKVDRRFKFQFHGDERLSMWYNNSRPESLPDSYNINVLFRTHIH